MQIEPTLKLALSMHSNPGVYALLLGSGISRPAGIPTGWEIVLNLIRKVAALEKESPEPDPETWYRTRFGKLPSYSVLLRSVTSTAPDRASLLRAYFEPRPDGEDSEPQLKKPTQAHRAIAWLVKHGYVRMILTVNFDRLMELALQDEGIDPDVIATDDAIKGAVPYPHSKCTIVKLHGDYRDGRIKNTPKELGQYSKAMNSLLDRILDDFALIVCGWSAEYDTALRDAIRRTPNRRFTTYWLAKGELTQDAVELTKDRRAEVVQIESADGFFSELQEKVESLRELDRPDPLSTKVAVETVKRYLTEERHRIRLHGLVRSEIIRTRRAIEEETARRGRHGLSPEVAHARLHAYEAVSERLIAIMATLGYYGRGDQSRLLTDCVEVLVQPVVVGRTTFDDLHMHSVFLTMYAAGICALASSQFSVLAALLVRPQSLQRGKRQPALLSLKDTVLLLLRRKDLVPLKEPERHHTPLSEYLLSFLRPYLASYVVPDENLVASFDTFEYLLSLAHYDLEKREWALTGSFAFRYGDDWAESQPRQFIVQGIEQNDDWPLLTAGFFGGSVDRLKAALEGHDRLLREIRGRMH